MKLWEYVGKTIRLTDIDGLVFEGKCTGYTSALDNDSEIASIDVDTTNGTGNYEYEIYENEIKSIEIMKD